MSIQGVSTGATAGFTNSTGRFSLSGAQDFAQTLNLGQIIKGKVLRQFEGNRYLVTFEGRDKVVDSTIPLTTGELIRGRVVALGDHVELQRVYSEEEVIDAEIPDAGQGQLEQVDRREQWLQQLLSRFQIDLGADERAALNRVAASASEPAAMGMVGIVLSRLGLQQTPELLNSVYSLLKRTGVSPQTEALQAALSTDSSSAEAMGAPIVSTRQLADILAKATGQTAAAAEGESASSSAGETSLPNIPLAINPRLVKQLNDDDTRGAAEQAAWRLLNSQAGGTVAHRVGTLPLLLGDRLVEVSVAFFEQRKDSEQQPQAQHRQMVFALRMEHLGAVQIKAQVSGERVRVRVITETEEKAQQIAGYTAELRDVLTQCGWQIDEVSYETQHTEQSTDRNPAVASVVEHIAFQDSLNRLV